jgi:hypothetical protein
MAGISRVSSSCSARFNPEGYPMRKAGLALALVACAQLTMLSSPAFADGTSASLSASSSSTTSTTADSGHAKKGWIVFGIGAGVTVGGIVLDIIGTQVGHVAGEGGPGDSGKTSNARTNFYWGGTSLIVAGIVTSIIGGSMIAGKDTEGTRRDTTEEDAKSDAVTKTVAAAYQAAPSFTIPVLGATF